MDQQGRPVVVVVFGCPGAGKTTVASETARRLGVPLMARMGVPHITQDEYKNGLGLSTARAMDSGQLRPRKTSQSDSKEARSAPRLLHLPLR